MPELPEVEAVVRGLQEDGLEGDRIVSAVVLRASCLRPQTPDDLSRLTESATFVKVHRRAKNILLTLSNDYTIRVHLRMTGDLRIFAASDLDPAATRITWTLSTNQRLVFSDARALGKVHVLNAEELDAALAGLGPEPLSRSFTVAQLIEMAAASHMPAKLFLMDQTKIVGLGNIYAAEALLRARISPTRPMDSLTPAKLKDLHTAIREVLRSAIQSIYKAYRLPGGYRQHQDDFQRMAYGQEGNPCAVCGRPIQRITQGGRSTYFCKRCQR